MATFLCLVYDDRQQLPTNRAELYGDALRILLERWAASKRVHGEPVFPGLSTKRELLMLEGIAGPAYEREQYFFTAQELATAIEGFLRSDANGPDKVDGRKVVEEIERKQGLLVQRAHDKYSFSHLTLHEYLAACHYYNAGRSREVAKATLTKERWREVHLLLAGLQEPDADAFLMAMTTETAEQVTSEPLKGLLSWAERIVRVDRLRNRPPQDVPDDGVRPRPHPRPRPLPRPTALRPRPHLRPRFRPRPRPRPRPRFARDLDLARDSAFALDRALDRAHAHAIELDLEHVLRLGSAIVRQRIITADRSAGLAEACNALDRYLTKPGVSADPVLQEVENALDFPRPARPFSQSDARQCVEFLTRTQHILECREAAERVKQVGWDKVCERLIALPRSEQGV